MKFPSQMVRTLMTALAIGAGAASFIAVGGVAASPTAATQANSASTAATNHTVTPNKLGAKHTAAKRAAAKRAAAKRAAAKHAAAKRAAAKRAAAKRAAAKRAAAKRDAAKRAAAKRAAAKREAARGRAAHRQVAAVTPDAALLAMPSQNLSPSPDFVADCPVAPVTVACVSETVAAVNAARSAEGVAPLQLDPNAFLSLTNAEQLFVITNLERLARGLAPVTALTSQLDAVAAQGAAGDGDPSLNGWTLAGGSSAVEWASNWAGDLNELGADYFWMYYDGVGSNIDCNTPSASGCWGHRRNVLTALPSATMCGGASNASLVMGAADLPTGYAGTPSIATIYVGVCGALPSDIELTWAHAQQLLAA